MSADRRWRTYALIMWCLFGFAPHAAWAEALGLPAVGANLNGVTVSGLSSGGYMAVQFQVAYAALVTGVGVIAAGPYECARGELGRAVRNCMQAGHGAPPPSWRETREQIERYARDGLIDSPEGLLDDRVWVFSGTEDQTVRRPVVDSLVDFYRSYLPDTAVRYIASVPAGHAMLSVFASNPHPCASSSSPFINQCDTLDAPGALLTHLLGTRTSPGVPDTASLHSFSQRAFTEGHAPADWSLAEQGYVYIPAACQSGGCRVHVVFHGCRQSVSVIGTTFIEEAGYNHWAESNRLIILYPQTISRWAVLWWGVNNPNGCWDWWGYTDKYYATRKGVQIRTVRAMLDQLALPSSPAAQRIR